jgi:hypothetical protein
MGPKIHYRVHNSQSLAPVLSHHTRPFYFLNIHFYILPSTPWSSKWSVPPREKNGMAEEKEEEENAELQETSHYARNTAHI